MTRFLLIRHALTDATESTLIGRSPGIHLSQRGIMQANQLAPLVRRFRPDIVLTSPRERAVETANRVAEACHLKVDVDSSFDECDFGRWTGMTFATLAGDPEWKAYNSRRSFSAAPGGESLHDVQYRAIRRLNQLSQQQAGKSVAVVTHADVIRSVLTYVVGVPLDLFLRFNISPASLTIVSLGADYPVVEGINLIAPDSRQ